MAILVLASGNAFAQDCKAKCDNDKACKNATINNNKMYQPREFTEFAFEGILLTPEQQEKINALNAEVKANRSNADKAACDKKCDKKCDKQACDKKCDKKCDGKCQGKCDKKCDGKCDKQNCPTDSATCKKGMKKGEMHGRHSMAGRRGGMNPDQRRQYAARVKEILTDEQYEVFLKNVKAHEPKAMGQGRFQGAKMRGDSIKAGRRAAIKASKK